MNPHKLNLIITILTLIGTFFLPIWIPILFQGSLMIYGAVMMYQSHPLLFRWKKWFFNNILKYHLINVCNKENSLLSYPILIWIEFTAPDLFASSNRKEFTEHVKEEIDSIYNNLAVSFKDKYNRESFKDYNDLTSEEERFINKTLNKN